MHVDIAKLAAIASTAFTPYLLSSDAGITLRRYPACANPLRLAHHDLVRQPRIPLRSLDRSVTQDLLKRSEVSPTLQPLTRERVAHLVDVETLDSRCAPHDRRERARR